MDGSGDLLADRRYAYGRAALDDGDAVAAADLAGQAIEIAPRFAAAWFLLGEARERQHRAASSVDEGVETWRAAVDAYRMALLRDPEDAQGAGLRLAALGEGDPLEAMSPTYVRRLFDDYAIRFDRHLVSSLKYRAPDLLERAVRQACGRLLRELHFAVALDLGCGTGLAGEVFRPLCARLDGVDLAPAMVERARRKKLYGDLAIGDLVEWLSEQEERSADLVLAADVLVYVGDLRPVFHAVARVLARGGLFAFTVQSHDGRSARLGEDLRYAHAPDHVAALATDAGMTVIFSESASTREDRGQPVPGQVFVLSR